MCERDAGCIVLAAAEILPRIIGCWHYDWQTAASARVAALNTTTSSARHAVASPAVARTAR